MNDLSFLQQSCQGYHDYQQLVALSSSMAQATSQLLEAVNFLAPILISGPPGSGKKFAALALHLHSPQRSGPVQLVHCGQLASQRLMEEITIRWPQANQGTLILDQIHLISTQQREQMITFLDAALESIEGAASRVILLSSNPLALSLRQSPKEVMIPPLSKRQKDLPLLVQQILWRLQKQVHLSDQVWECFEQYTWPGNVREMANLLERLALLHPNKIIMPQDLPRCMENKKAKAKTLIPDEGIDLNLTIDEMESSLILSALEKTQGNKNQAAKLLRINRTTLIEKMKKKQIIYSHHSN